MYKLVVTWRDTFSQGVTYRIPSFIGSNADFQLLDHTIYPVEDISLINVDKRDTSAAPSDMIP
jgi:hypothetical protein